MIPEEDGYDSQEKRQGTFAIGFLVILFLIFLILLISLSFLRNMYFSDVNTQISALDKEIREVKKEYDVLLAKETKYSAPNRFIEIGIQSGLIEPRGENDILYLQIEREQIPKVHADINIDYYLKDKK